MKIKIFGFLAIVFFTISSFETISQKHPSFNYDHCIGEAQEVEQSMLDDGQSAEFAYNFGNTWYDSCVNDVDIAAAEYWAEH